MRKQFPHSSFSGSAKAEEHLSVFFKILLLALILFISAGSFAQSLPPPNSCTSKDLLLVSATLPPNPGDDACGTCTAGTTVTRHLILSINNKTGSTRTSFAFWGTLEVYNSDGTLASTRAINRCKGPIPKNATTPIDFDTIQYECGQSLKMTNLYLAWTSASPGETCPLNASTIAPKCGTLDEIVVVAGLDASFNITNATCTAGGSIAVSPFGGKAPYSVTIGSETHSNIPAGGSTTFTGLAAGGYSITITDATTPDPCTTTKTRTVGSSSAPDVSGIGGAFTKTCTQHTSGANIGETPVSGFSYSWSPSSGLSNASIGNPTANPTSTTTYTVTKTNNSTNCSAQATVTVTVNTTQPSVSGIGGGFTKTCTQYTSGSTIGETPISGFSYSWSPSTDLSNASIGNPTANPSSTTTYTVTKTDNSNGCTNTAQVTVTVNTTQPSVSGIGGAFTKTCTQHTSGATIGETPVSGFSYSWSPSTGLSNAAIGNPTANPSSTTTYTVTKTDNSNGCTNTAQVTVTVNTDAPTFTVCLVNPTLCANSGSVTIYASGGSGFMYSIDGVDFSNTTGVFDNLGSGSVTSIQVKNSDGCVSTPADCSATNNCPPPLSPSLGGNDEPVSKAVNTIVPITGAAPIVKAYPNPYNDMVKFVITTSEAGQGSLDVVNVLGQKIKTVFQGHLMPGSQTFEMMVPAAQRSTLFYIFRLNDKQVTGKLIALGK